jgi:hypothetical protein
LHRGAKQEEDKIKEDEMGWKCGMQREKSIQGFVGEI